MLVKEYLSVQSTYTVHLLSIDFMKILFNNFSSLDSHTGLAADYVQPLYVFDVLLLNCQLDVNGIITVTS